MNLFTLVQLKCCCISSQCTFILDPFISIDQAA